MAEAALKLPEPKKHVSPLAGQNFGVLGQVCMDFYATPRAGLTLSDVIAPSYWLAVCDQMKQGCEIRVIPEDNTWYAKLLVLSKDSISATVAVIYYSDLEQKSTVSSDEFEVRPTQNNTRHGVFRKIDSQIIRGGFVTEKQASDFLNDYVRAAAA